jgi:hypothetical protein
MHLVRLVGVINAVGFLHGDGLQPEKSNRSLESAIFYQVIKPRRCRLIPATMQQALQPP